MTRSIVRMMTLGAAAIGLACVAQPASATAYLFSFTGADQTASPGTSLNYTLGSGSTALTLNVFGYHLNDGNGSNQTAAYGVSMAKAETYKNYGLGVLYGSDTESDGSHQIDNVGDGVDLVALSFSKSVTLSTINRTAYGISVGSGTSYDSDAAFMPYYGSSTLSDSSFTQLASGMTATGSTASSSIWLVSASTLATNRNDGFKITDLKVFTPDVAAVPEPATWAMMLVGFGVIGAATRRRRPNTLGVA